MSQGKIILIALVMLIVGFAIGFVMRPVVAPQHQAPGAAAAAPQPASVPSEPRGTQYFVEHVAEARRIVAGCRDGSVRGGECATAEEALIKVDAAERRKRFLGK